MSISGWARELVVLAERGGEATRNTLRVLTDTRPLSGSTLNPLGHRTEGREEEKEAREERRGRGSGCDGGDPFGFRGAEDWEPAQGGGGGRQGGASELKGDGRTASEDDRERAHFASAGGDQQSARAAHSPSTSRGLTHSFGRSGPVVWLSVDLICE